MSIDGAYYMKVCVQRIKRQNNENAKSQGMYAIFDLTRRYGNENGNGRSAASGTLGKFSANKRQGFTFLRKGRC